MLSKETIRRVQQMLLSGAWSQHQIARQFNIRRATVAQLATQSSDCPTEEVARRPKWLTSIEGLPTTRCGGCGGMVVLPCRLCELRAALDQQRDLRRLERRRAA